MDVSAEELQDSYRLWITAVFDAISPRPEWMLQFASGSAGEVLIRQSLDARLLVVGTREHAGMGRLLTGSVSHYILSHAGCPLPLLIARPRILTRSGGHPRGNR